MKFKIGDKIVMDRRSKFFIEDVVVNLDSTLVWWSALEKIQPLTIKKIEEIYGGEQNIYMEDTGYIVSNKWVKLFRKESGE